MRQLSKKIASSVGALEATAVQNHQQKINESVPQNPEDVKRKPFDEDAFLQKLKKINTGKYGMTLSEYSALRHIGDAYTSIYLAFKYGYLKGQRSERAAIKRRVKSQEK